MTSWITGSLKSLFSALWPPGHEEDPTQWRRLVFVTLTTMVFVMGLHLAAAKGFLEPYGLSGFASTAQVKEVENKTDSILYAIYAPQIRATIRERCDTSDPREREQINKRLDRILREYEAATGERFQPIPRCDEV